MFDSALSGRTVVITGAASGIGMATARLAVQRGANVVLTDLSEDALQKAVEGLGPRASYRVLNVTDAAAVDDVMGSVGTIDHLFTCASGNTIAAFTDLTEEQVRAFFEIKWWGQYRCVKAALPHIPKETGSITLVSGFLYRKVDPGFSAYAAVNGAVEGTVKSLALELAPLRVNALAPGPIDTHAQRMGEAEHRAYREAVSAQLPVGRPGSAEEVAHSALYLMENTFTTGITLDVDGGKR
ncbi:KR domain-containing protein [Streptomyces sp. V2]|uniref:SDR family NAD(P)-dependent oxidoreductase n=1 Tax=Streptomyces TaxID=1883 RepID=UPI0007C83081|nr:MULTISPECIES: SDR family oxidoreductase [Streptomyces]PWG07000.1 KR domain-containing protein [Streptomyces sp. V2]QZZ25577.1 SDR family oxidoreductase [Streptomyces sp. ST1015]